METLLIRDSWWNAVDGVFVTSCVMTLSSIISYVGALYYNTMNYVDIWYINLHNFYWLHILYVSYSLG